MPFKFKEFLALAPGFVVSSASIAPEQTVAGVSIDSRSISSGEVYFALVGENHDGHGFVADAFAAGASAAIVSHDFLRANQGRFAGHALLAVDDTLVALQAFAKAHRNKFDVQTVALTGSNGKTSTKEMIAAVLAKQGSVCKSQGNFNNHIGAPLTLLNLDQSHDFLVVEMGANHFGEIASLCEIVQPQTGLITNIGHGHTEFFGDLTGVLKAKLELFDFLQPDGLAFTNVDDPLLAGQIQNLRRVVTYGFQPSADISAEELQMESDGCGSMRVGGMKIKPNAVGLHNVRNALAAIAIGSHFGVSLQDSKEALENLKIPEKRLEISRVNGVTIINDSYNANPESTRAALETLQAFKTGGKRVFVFGDMLELGACSKEEHRKIGEAVAELGIEIFLAHGAESSAAVAACRQTSPAVQAEHFQDKADLAGSLQQQLTPGDVLLVKGSRGMRMEEIITGLHPVGDK